MNNWLQKLGAKSGSVTNLPVTQRQNSPVASSAKPAQHQSLPAATIVYAIAAAALIAVAVCFVISGAWVKGALVLLPAACLLGFAIHFLKNG